MAHTFSESVTMTKVDCCSCGVCFAFPRHLEDNLRRSHDWFYCPNGHKQHFSGESTEERLQRNLNSTQATVNNLRVQYEAANRAKEKAEKSLKSLKKRTAAGVCPCCSRTVSQLARHMETQHKEYRELNGLAPHKALPESTSKVQ